MGTIKERISVAETQIVSHSEEIEELRKHKHNTNMTLQTHSGIINGMESSVKDLIKVVGNVNGVVNKLIWASCGGVAVGGVLLSFIVYIAKLVLEGYLK